MRSGGGDDADSEPGRQAGQHGVAFVVERLAMMGQLDADPACPNRSTSSASARPAASGPPRKAPGAHGLCDIRSGCASARRPPWSARRSRNVACPFHRRPDARRPAAATAAGSLPGRGPAPADAGRAGPGARCGHQTPKHFGAEHGMHVKFRGRFGEPHRAVQAVVVGQRQRTQIQPGGLLDQLLRRAGAVEEAVRRMRMQLGVRDRRRAIRSPPGGSYLPRLRDKGTSSRSLGFIGGAPAWRGLPSSTRSISAQLGGPLNQPTPTAYRSMFDMKWWEARR